VAQTTVTTASVRITCSTLTRRYEETMKLLR